MLETADATHRRDAKWTKRVCVKNATYGPRTVQLVRIDRERTPLVRSASPRMCHERVRCASAIDGSRISSGEVAHVKAAALALFLAVATCDVCLAGTTGVMHGYVRDATGNPAANAVVTATSPSQTCTTSTDERGFYVCMSLSPDVYSVLVHKIGTSNAYAPRVRVSSDHATFLVFQFALRTNCLAYIQAPLSADPFTSLDVRRMETYPRSVAPLIPLPMALTFRQPGCL
jgi:hypothetical protein